MKVVSFITEYNPFHYGHKFHLEKSLYLTDATHSISIMSSSFVQRGEPSIVDKWTKAKMAIENGVDLVIELPFIFSVQSAELFALGGIKVMDALNIVDYIAFGSEVGNLEPLQNIADILIQEPDEYKKALKYHLNLGLSFPAARSKAIIEYFKSNKSMNFDYENIIKQSNNILAIEYLKALNKLNSSITPVAISRQGSDYKEINLSTSFASATAIRRNMLEKNINYIKDSLPQPTYELLETFYNKFNKFNHLENYDSIIRYLILTTPKSELEHILDMEHGLENRIIDKSFKSQNIKELIENSSTKRYPKTRIQRILVHLLNDISKETIKELYLENIPYIRFLGANNKGLELLNAIKERSSVPILTKFSHVEKTTDEITRKFASLEKKATDIYFLGLNEKNNFNNMDYKTSPYIKK